jgi:hypothetical protein
MNYIRAKVLGALIAVLILGAAIAVPGIALGEEGPQESSPSAEASPLLEESCPEGNVCVWTENHFHGTRGETDCTAIGRHKLAGTKHSAKNRCPNRASGLDLNLEAFACLNPGDNAENLQPGINEVIMAESTSFRCS